MAKNFIAGAIKHPGALHKALGIPEGKRIPDDVLNRAAKQSGIVGREARLAKTLRGLNKKKT